LFNKIKTYPAKRHSAFIGLSSENGAHRIAVEWDDNGEVRQGVYIPRRDTSSIINNLVGGRIFPGEHCLAKFNVEEVDGNYAISFKSSDNTSIAIEAKSQTISIQTRFSKTFKLYPIFLRTDAWAIRQMEKPNLMVCGLKPINGK
jgi:hypothetical protein